MLIFNHIRGYYNGYYNEFSNGIIHFNLMFNHSFFGQLVLDNWTIDNKIVFYFLLLGILLGECWENNISLDIYHFRSNINI